MLTSGHAKADLAELGRACAQGLRVLARETRHVSVGTEARVSFAVQANRCVRVLAASDGPALTLTLADDERVSRGWNESLAVVPLLGPRCFAVATQVQAVLSSPLAAEVLVEVWQSEASP